MSHTRRPAELDGYRAELAKTRRPIDHKGFELLRNQVVEALDSEGRLLVQKARRTEKPEGILEIVCSWSGVDPDPRAAADALRKIWPFAAEDKERHLAEPVHETVVLLSALEYGDRYATIRVLIIP